MKRELRNKRIRRLVHSVNEKRKKQAVQIDILCNDIVATHRKFICKLDTISFTAYFYRQILGKTDLNSLLNTAGNIIRQKIGVANAAFFLRKTGCFEPYAPQSEDTLDSDGMRFANYFTRQFAEQVCKANKICDLNRLLEIGLQASPIVLKKISAVTIPVGTDGVCTGFVLLWQSFEKEFSAEQIEKTISIIPGLSEAIDSCLGALPAAK